MAATRKRQVFVGTFIHSKSRAELEYLHETAVCVDEKGVIVHIVKGYAGGVKALVESLGWVEDEVDVLRCKEGQFFFPGFIDTHIHASQYPNAGIFGKSTLLDWLTRYTFPLEASLSSLPRARRVYQSVIRRTLRHGTTTAAYFATIDVPATNLLIDLCLSLGQRAFVGRVCMDREGFNPDYYRDESAGESVRRTRETAEYVKSVDPGFELVSPIVTPRFAPSCTMEAMKGLAEIQKEMDLPVQTHLSENEGEIELVAQLFPKTASYTDVYDQAGLLTKKTVLAHAVHLTDGEAAVLAARGSGVSHCPCSNSSLTSGAARVRWLWGQGVTVGLGTDVSGGYSPSILESARQAALVSRHVAMGDTEEMKEGNGSSKLTVEEVLYLGTRGGAEVVGLQDKVGGFEVGKEWDAQLVGLGAVEEEGESVDGVEIGEDEGNVDIFGWEDWEEKMAKWLYGGDDRNTKKVWVKGRLVHARKGA